MHYAERPSASSHSEYHATLIAKVPDGNILELLAQQIPDFREFLTSIPEDQSHVVHEPYAWTVRQVVEHCADAERVFGYRSLRYANGDKTELPGWDENVYADSGYGGHANLSQLADEYCALRAANLAMLTRLDPAAWDRGGVADGNPFSVRSIAWLMVGHGIHHLDILKARLGM